MTNKLEDSISLLELLLEEEKTALLEGNLELISYMLEKKRQLIEEINESSTPTVQSLSNLNEKVQRNQALLESAMEGIKNVSERLDAMRRIRSSIDTYDAWGKKKQIDMPKKGNVEKRA